MSQADSGITDQRYEYKSREGTCNHFQYTGCNRKDGKSHS
ncbi:MAG: BPTI/Kunitz-type proteinase inhibitor domain-containing protein [Lachnospiraceae bacterium]